MGISPASEPAKSAPSILRVGRLSRSDREQERLDRVIGKVLKRDACSGCGGCTNLDSGIQMQETTDGYLRPTRVASGRTRANASQDFTRSCPGMTVTANSEPHARTHDTMGSYLAVWVSWATDHEVRHRGSSGGVLTALSEWLVASGRASRVVGAASAPDPRRSVPVTIMSRAEALAAAGSRYTPVATLSNTDVLLPDSAVVAKPCEASALSALTQRSEVAAGAPPLLLAFFCAGTPSALATDRLLAELGVDRDTQLDALWYRGRGWPGRFTAETAGTSVSADYDESWGRTLGPTTQWRCKICPDGVGESADIVAADYWTTDDRGYPSFTEGDGASALIARTRRGLETILQAAADGVLRLEEVSMDSLAAVQPLQRERRNFLAARLLGSRLAGRPVPRYRGFPLIRLSLKNPRKAVTVLRGAYRRVRRSRTAAE